MIDFALSPSQHALRAAAASFAQSHLSTVPSLHPPPSQSTQLTRFRSTRPVYSAAVRTGLLKAQIPAALGGTAHSLLDAALVVEELYAVEPSAALTLLGTGLGLTPLVLAGSEEQRARFLAPFLDDSLGGEPLASFVHSEPRGTANWLEKGARGLGTTARREGDDWWIVDGEKLWTTNSGGWDGRGAQLQCVVCRYVRDSSSSSNEGPQGPDRDPADDVLVLLVTPDVVAANPPDAYQVLDEPELAGFRSTSGPHSRFTGLRVPHANLLCPPGMGAQVVEQTFGTSAALVGAMGVGIMRAAFDAAIKFAKDDSRGGNVPILERQSVADLLMDVKMRTETSRLLTWKALHALEKGPGDWKARLELALQAKIYSSEAAVQSVIDAMKAVGITSYATDQPFSKLLNEAMVLPLFDGGNVGVRRRQIQKIFLDAGYEPWVATYGQAERGQND
ncbi:acyl-CoA dehydrogenase/oxidase [Phyllosticta citrichinensis]|uniref:Acyl-CoA dehydrogenase/oxidase n=1 Tax=Phyllosticta citrichinensis TaxID=1130410 RepID=A0ABR1XUR6_9PEZI